jgi:hypothetical protein
MALFESSYSDHVPSSGPSGHTGPMSAQDKKIIDERDLFTMRVKDVRVEKLMNFYENMLYYLGHQWVEPSRATRGSFVASNFKKGTPTPVTNMIKPTVDTVGAELAALDPVLTFAPGSDKDIDRLTAEGANLVIDYCSETIDLDSRRLEAATAVVVYNNWYFMLDHDADGGRQRFIGYWVCPVDPSHVFKPEEAMKSEGLCPLDKVPLSQSEDQGEQAAEGRLVCESLSPFEVWLDPAIKRNEDHTKLLIRRLKPVDWVKNTYPQMRKRYDGDYSPPKDQGLSYLMSIMRLSAGGGGGLMANRGAVMGGLRFQGMEVVDDFHQLPCKEFPKGNLARLIDSEVLESRTPYPFHDGTPTQRGRAVIPFVHWKYDDVPNCHYATGPMDHLKTLQRARNRLQSAMELAFARMANGVWAIPEGSDTRTPPGTEGGVIRFNKTLGEPHRIEGQPPNPGYSQRFAEIDAEMLKITGINEVFQGDAPGRVDAGFAMNILRERAQSRFAALYRGHEQSYQELARKMYMVFRLFAPPTTFYAIKGEQSRWQLQALRAADMMGAVDIRAEAGSSRPKTILQKQANAEKLIQLGLIDIQDPNVRLQILRLMEAHEFMNGANADDNTIAQEHAEVILYARTYFDPSGQLTVPIEQLPEFPALVDMLLDNHPMHWAKHRLWMLSDEYKTLPEPVKEMFRTGHFEVHIQAMSMTQATGGGAGGEQGQSPGGGGATGEAKGQGNEQANAQGQGTSGRATRKQQSAESGMAA